jgi:acetyl/propionyl-CoA carboxylase alpha subunit
MFEKILIANRGEIALRVIRTCRDLGIRTVAVFTPVDRQALHVRLADECAPLQAPLGYRDREEVLAAARRTGAQAIHPGYGFLAEDPEFARACAAAGIVFIGPPPELLATFQDKIGTLQRVAAAGYATPAFSAQSAGPQDDPLIEGQAASLTYPLVIKSCSGGRGRATRIVFRRDQLHEQVRQARREADNVYGDSRLYLESVIAPSRHLTVQVIGDGQGNLIHVGERDGSLQRNNQKLVEESPAPHLSPAQRADLWARALGIAKLFDFQGVGGVEFLMDAEGQFYFTEIKPRIMVEHPVTEMVALIDLVREQIELAAGSPLRLRQEDIHLRGCALQCRVSAEDPWNNFMPSPGVLRKFRVPGGAQIRVDSYGCAGCTIPVQYDPILAKLVVWGETREECINRMRRALDEFVIRGVRTNITLLYQLLENAEFQTGTHDTGLMLHPLATSGVPEPMLRDLAVAAAVAFAAREESSRPSVPAQLLSGWHRSSRAI